MNSDIVIATTTFYPTGLVNVRAQEALETARKAQERKYPLLVVDGGSPWEFLDAMAKFGAIIIMQVPKGVGPGRRQVLEAAAAFAMDNNIARAIFAWMEPEKHDLIRDLEKLADPIRNGEADVTIPNRIHMADDYPSVQAQEEALGNHGLFLITGVRADYYSGPRLMNLAALGYFLHYEAEKRGFADKWDSIFVPLLDCIKAGLRIVSVDVDYHHPAAQKAEEEGNSYWEWVRFVQFFNLVQPMHRETVRLGICKIPTKP